MPNQYKNKVVYYGDTLIDLSGDTLDASKVLSGYTGHDATGAPFTGSIATKTSSDLTVSGATVTAPAGYYASSASKSVGNMTLPSSTSNSSSGTRKASIYANGSSKQYLNIPIGYNSTAQHYEIGKIDLDTLTVSGAGTYYAQDEDLHGYSSVVVPSADASAASWSASYITESSQRKWRAIYSAYAESAGWVDEGAFGIAQEYKFNAVPANTTVTPSTSAQTIGGPNYMMEGAVTVSAMPSGTAGTPTATKGTVSNHAVSVTPSVTNTTGYITGGTKTGTAVSVTASELVSGTYTVDSSGTKDVTNYASASVPAGTAGTPSASKGTVSNHSILVTPSVTNSTGWITGSTKTGTAVSVSASELVSGNLSITENTTSTPIDVTNYATVTVNVQGSAGNVWQDENGYIHLDSEGPGDSYATGTVTPVERVASISFDTGLSGTIHGVMVVPTSESPWKSNGRTLGAFYSFNPGTQFITYFTWSSNAGGSSGSSPQFGTNTLGYTQSGSVVTVTSPNVSYNGYFETVSYTWVVW